MLFQMLKLPEKLALTLRAFLQSCKPQLQIPLNCRFGGDLRFGRGIDTCHVSVLDSLQLMTVLL